MRTVIKISSFFLCSFLVFSCSKGGDGTPEENNVGYVQIADTKMDLAQAYLEDYGEFESGVYNLDLSILSKAAQTSDTEQAAVYFEMFSSTAKDLAVGEYTVGVYPDVKANNYSTSSELLIGTELKFNTSEQVFEIKNGLVVRPTSGTMRIISASSTEYEVRYQGYGDVTEYKTNLEPTYKTDVAIKAYYKGSMKYYEGEEVPYSTESSASDSQSRKLRRNFVNQAN
ncbi:MAG: hypothetical protein ACK5JS_00630 [Mangrovibacterium sp.]